MPIKPENKARYPADWDVIVYRVRLRSHNQCEFLVDGKRCNAHQGWPHPITGSRVVLTVAHLDHTPEHSELWNLRHGCQRCHNRYDAEHRAQSRNQEGYTQRQS